MVSRMTLRVGRVGADGVATYGRRRVVEVEPDKATLRDDVFRLPPCECPRHRPDLHTGDAVLQALRNALRER